MTKKNQGEEAERIVIESSVQKGITAISPPPPSSHADEECLFCDDLATEPIPQIGTVLVTGASGYIGGRLVPELLARGYRVRIMLRAVSAGDLERWPGTDMVAADALDPDSLARALRNVHTAYYLIHSLVLGPREFASADIAAARNFRETAQKAGVKRIIYLGGLGRDDGPLSDHLRSRKEVADELRRGAVPVTSLQAAVIIGSGSASFEIIYHLVKNVFAMPVPTWARKKCQPIGIRDVIKYLVGVLEIPRTAGKRFDIGGNDVLTYEEMIKALAGVVGRRVHLLACPISNLSFYAYCASLFTPVPASITRCLIEGLRNNALCGDLSIKSFLPFETLSYRESIVRALTRDEQDRIATRWSDAYPPAHELAIKLHELKETPGFTASYSLFTCKSPARIFASLCKIGGRQGWFYGNWMWRLRGTVDRMLLGVGCARGRRSRSRLKTNDVIDFWRVEDLRENERLLLRAEMKLPGRAWLEFRITPEEKGHRLAVKAWFAPEGWFGPPYWYMFLPFHRFIFKNLISRIEKTAGNGG